MRPLIAFGLWEWVDKHRHAFEPPVSNKVIWEDSQFTASDEIFYMLKGDMVLEYMQDGRRHHQTIHEGELLLVPASTPHSPHRPADSWGLVVEVKRRPEQLEALLWFCERCDAQLHEVTLHVADIEKDLRAAIEEFDGSRELRTCRRCGHVQP